MDKVYPIFFEALKFLGVKNPTEGKYNKYKYYYFL